MILNLDDEQAEVEIALHPEKKKTDLPNQNQLLIEPEFNILVPKRLSATVSERRFIHGKPKTSIHMPEPIKFLKGGPE